MFDSANTYKFKKNRTYFYSSIGTTFLKFFRELGVCSQQILWNAWKDYNYFQYFRTTIILLRNS